MRSTGISSRARSGSSCSASVPSRAASVSLSARSARCSGWRRRRSTSSPRPTTIPACGPPSSLSPEKQTRSEPAAMLDAAVGSSPTSASEPEPRSSTSHRPASCATRARSSVVGLCVKPTIRKFDWWTRRRSAVSADARSKSTARVRFVVPTSTIRAPEWARTSGIRKPSPISTSSPRETTTSRPAASAASASKTAAALLFTTSAASAPVRRRSASATWSWRDPRVPDDRSSSGSSTRRRRRSRVRARLGQRGASQVGVDDHPGGVDDPAEGRGAEPLELRADPTRSPGSSPERIASRARSRADRAAAVASARGAAASTSSPSSRSTEGRSRRCMGSV